jgi:hypothetical protein
VHRPSLRSVLTTVAAAAVLVGGADLTAYAATGNAFILGHSNSAGGTTSLKNTGRGPALSLNNIKSAPPLVVNSRKMVKNLNADTVDGGSAKDLNGYLMYRVGKDGQTLSNDLHLFEVKAPAGDYQWSMTGLWISDTSTDTMLCLVTDARFLADPSNTNFVYGLFSKQASDTDAPFVQQQGYAHFGKHQHLLLGCSTSGDVGPLTTIRAITFAFHPVLAQHKQGTPVTVKHARFQGLTSR